MNKVLSFEEFYNSVWLKVPSVWRDADDENGKALQLLVYTMAQHMYYYFYNKVVYMDQLFDPDLCPTPYLKFLASMVGWKLIGSDEASWREQIKAAPLLYKVKGTKRGIALAERLVGYSVFMSDLYRDHVGDIVPKEHIFNNTPDEITNKPWFRTTSRDDSGNTIPGSIVSDLFDSYNEGDASLGVDGKVIRPFVDTTSNSLAVRANSTTPEYNNLTGEGSLARYAKTPRINVVLKKVAPLDSLDSKGSIGSSNIDEALDLLLQFKPFHVFINDIKVMVDLSDYVLGFDGDNTGGDGSNADDTINYHENFDFSVYVKNDEAITYRSPSTSLPIFWEPTTDQTTISAKFKSYNLNNLPRISDLQTINKLGLSTKDYILHGGTKYGYVISNGRVITPDDFLTSDNEALFASDDIAAIDFIDAETREIRLNSLDKIPSFDFRLLDLSTLFNGTALYHFKSAFISKKNLFGHPVPTISDVVLIGNGQLDSLSILYNGITEVQNSTIPGTNKWNLKNIQAFHSVSGLVSGSLIASQRIATMQELFTNTFAIAINYAGTAVMIPALSYTINEKQIVLDTVGIAKLFSDVGITLLDDSFIDSSTLYILYLEQSKEADDFPTEKTSRSMYLHERSNKKFSRQFDVPNPEFTTSRNIKATSNYIFNTKTGALDVDSATTQVYRADLPVFTRGTLRQQIADGGNTPVVIKNPLNVCDTHQWKVYSNMFTMYYAGSEKISNVWWTDFYQAPAGDPADQYLIEYSTVDTSSEAQIENRTSARWKAALNGLDTTNPAHFLATRRSDFNRNNIWTRGSALKLALPFNGSSRSSYQHKRGDIVLFNRTENMSDYAVQSMCSSTVSNFKYTFDKTNIDITHSYFNPVLDEEAVIVPDVENFGSSKVKIHPSIPSYTINTSNTTTIYDGSMTFVERLPYYSNQANGGLHVSPYACNMVTRNYPQLDILIHDGLDTLDFMIDGLLEHHETFTAVKTDGVVQTRFVLPYIDLFVCWYEVNTGDFVNSGNFSNSDTAIPNIKVFINGIQSLYGRDWKLSLDIQKAIVVENAQEFDVIKVEYQTLSTIKASTSPTEDEQTNTRRITLTEPMLRSTNVLGDLFTITLPTEAIVSWYDNITGQYLSTSKNAQTLMPTTNYETAYPNVDILWNDLTVKYGFNWKFVSAVEGGVTTSYIELMPEISYRLAVDDTLEISYQSSMTPVV